MSDSVLVRPRVEGFLDGAFEYLCHLHRRIGGSAVMVEEFISLSKWYVCTYLHNAVGIGVIMN